ncbi:MAG: SCO family protein [Alcaligenaceae bacterium]|uniref:SCO family protein n=1 Tax=Neopusillimonas maritima TaxID=2026239 RepID=A0A3A1Z0B3_9BURK|nr:SCO family protein [Neopusillimonas maritima]MAL01233.1 SCO family protein [Alcaligenaceae bacterium]RIY41777.1 SCO family protein [Neopusillimonas maritima]
MKRTFSRLSLQRYPAGLIGAILASAISLATPATSAQANPVETVNAKEETTRLHNIRGFLPDLRFELIGPDNEPVTAQAFRGNIVMLFFGYASCPDICPTTMAQLAQVMQKLGPDADRVRILFISVDPHRDTAEKLQAYVQAFDSHAIGLTGSEKQIADVARRYRVAYQIEEPSNNDPERYEVAHSRGIYIFDENGKARYLAADSESVDVLTDGVRTLLQ